MSCERILTLIMLECLKMTLRTKIRHLIRLKTMMAQPTNRASRTTTSYETDNQFQCRRDAQMLGGNREGREL